jgi:ribosomal protein L40E
MTICPNCSHQNPAGATQCEACFTPLPATISCPSCGATVQLDATFCGQCGTSLTSSVPPVVAPSMETTPSNLPPTVIAQVANAEPTINEPIAPLASEPVVTPVSVSLPPISPVAHPDPGIVPPVSSEVTAPAPATPVAAAPSSTQLQQQRFQLTHVQSGQVIEIPLTLNVVHIGKPNDQIPPDIDVSGFPCSEVVSRVHADIRVDGDSVYLEDVGSANGTYVNHNALPKGNRHLLRVGDRISLGKGDLVTFLFQDK